MRLHPSAVNVLWCIALVLGFSAFTALRAGVVVEEAFFLKNRLIICLIVDIGYNTP